MIRYNIPKENKDLQKYAFRRYFCRMLGFFVYVGVWAVGYIFYLQGPLAKPFTDLTMIIFCLAVVTSGWFIFKMSEVVFKRNVSGRIVSQKVTRTYDRGMNRRAGSSLGYNTYVHFWLLGKDERKRRIKLQLFEDGYDLYYREGDMVVSFRGLNYPICISAEKRGEHICTVCGVRRYDKKDENESDRLVCASCGRSLINIKDLRGLNL